MTPTRKPAPGADLRAAFYADLARGVASMDAACEWIRAEFDDQARADMRAVADDFKDQQCKEQLLRCAADYDKMGERAAQRADGKVAS